MKDWLRRLFLVGLIAALAVIGLFFVEPVVGILIGFVSLTLVFLVVWGTLYGLAKHRFVGSVKLVKAANIVLYFWAWWLYLLDKGLIAYLTLPNVQEG